MAIIKLKTFINAPPPVCFDLASSIDMHLDSMRHSREKVVAGKSSGTLNQGETVTWQARHLGLTWQIKIKMMTVKAPTYFEDAMVSGPFKFLAHRHYFQEQNNGTMMVDVFHYKIPLGIIGQAVDRLFIKRYLTTLLQCRNTAIKQRAESKTELGIGKVD